VIEDALKRKKNNVHSGLGGVASVMQFDCDEK
jgi:hypothetical protein